MKVGTMFKLDVDDNIYDRIAFSAKMGFDNAQLQVWDLSLCTEENVAEIKRACKDFNFTITALWCGWSGPKNWAYPRYFSTIGLVPADWRAHRMNELLRGAEFARKLGIQDIITHIGYLPDDPSHPNNMGVVEAVRHICRVIEDYDQYFLFETGEELPLSLMHLIQDTGMKNIGINFDPANLIMNGRATSAYVAAKFFGSYIRGFHAKDALQLEAPDFKKNEVLVGKGDVDYPSVFKALREIGYDGYITIERENFNDPNHEAELKYSKEFLEQFIA